MLRWKCLLPILCALATGCASFHEEHYFQTTDTGGTALNFFRVRVDGNAGLSRLRYLSGYYDERAVDLYFNEVKSPGQGSDVDIQPLFSAGQKSPGTEEVIKPLEPTSHGALVMIFSSNPNAVADTIGQFAETQQVADSLTNLFNRGNVRDARQSSSTMPARTARFTASAGELQALFDTLPLKTAAELAQKDAVRQTYLDVLRSVAITLGGDGKFANVSEAAAWIDAKRSESK